MKSRTQVRKKRCWLRMTIPTSTNQKTTKTAAAKKVPFQQTEGIWAYLNIPSSQSPQWRQRPSGKSPLGRLLQQQLCSRMFQCLLSVLTVHQKRSPRHSSSEDENIGELRLLYKNIFRQYLVVFYHFFKNCSNQQIFNARNFVWFFY